MLELTKKELEILREKLEDLRSKSQISAVLLQPVENLLQWVDIAIHDAEVCITGRGELSDGAWQREIPAAIDKIENPEKYVEAEIQALMDGIEGKKIENYAQMVELPTVEILARMIYQEDHSPENGGQNAIAFSVVNRLYAGNYLEKNKGKVNNLYGIVTSGGQYESIFDDKNNGRNTAYQPPIGADANELEKEAWENAKRLAAITYLAVEIYGEGSETEKGKCVLSGDEDVRANIMEFMETQKDSKGKEIKNIIGYYNSFRGPEGETSAEKYRGQDKIPIVNEKGEVVGNVFQKI